jgi:myo-inositol-1(or 4)-monophosphatase
MNNDYLKIAIRAVESSGKILVEYFEKLHDFKQKNQNIRDLVTEVDVLSEKNIKKIIRDFFPEHSINGEETGLLKKDSEYCWHIDPIDGTVNYSQGIPLCAVSIGLEFRKEIITGAIYNPFTEELFFASKGNGAFLNGTSIIVSNKSKIEEGLYVAAFSSDIGKNKNKEYEIFGLMNDATRGVMRLGSAALALAYLACGRIDGFWAKDLYPWDIAGGLALINEAGGQVSGGMNKQYSLKSKVLIASNFLIHEHLINKLKDL